MSKILKSIIYRELFKNYLCMIVCGWSSMPVLPKTVLGLMVAVPAMHAILASLWSHHGERFETALSNPCNRAWFESWGCVGCGEFLWARRWVLVLGFLMYVGEWLRGRSILCVQIWCGLSSLFSSWFCIDRLAWALHQR